MMPVIKERIEKIKRGEVPEGYKRTKVGVIPEDWSEGSLGDLFEFEGGYPASREQLSEEGICYLHYGDLHKNPRNYIDVDKDLVLIPKLNEEIDNIPSKYFLQDGDIVFADASEDYEGIGKYVVIYNKKNIPFVSGLHTIVARDKKNLIVRDYKRYAFLIHEVRKQFMTYASGISVYGISRSNLKKIKIAYPDKNEQKKIAQILSAWDKAIELKEKLIEQKKLQKKGLMHLLLTGKVRWSEIDRIDLKKGLDELEQGLIPQGYKNSKIGIIPNDWNVLKLRNIVQRIHRKNDGEDYPVLTISSLSGFLDQSERFSKVIAGENLSKYILLERGEFAYNKGNSKTYPYGCIYRLDSHEKALVPNVYYCFRVIYGDSEYYKQYFLAGALNRQLARVINTGVRNDGLLNIDAEDFFDCLIHVPPLEEQKKIAMVLSTADREIHLLEQELEALKQQKKGLMQLLLTGIVRVHELEQVECLTLCSS